MALSKVKSSKLDKKIELEVSWQHTQEPNLSFKRLMMLLLKPRQQENTEQ